MKWKWLGMKFLILRQARCASERDGLGLYLTAFLGRKGFQTGFVWAAL
jgi:hypothetical protein